MAVKVNRPLVRIIKPHDQLKDSGFATAWTAHYSWMPAVNLHTQFIQNFNFFILWICKANANKLYDSFNFFQFYGTQATIDFGNSINDGENPFSSISSLCYFLKWRRQLIQAKSWYQHPIDDFDDVPSSEGSGKEVFWARIAPKDTLSSIPKAKSNDSIKWEKCKRKSQTIMNGKTKVFIFQLIDILFIEVQLKLFCIHLFDQFYYRKYLLSSLIRLMIHFFFLLPYLTSPHQIFKPPESNHRDASQHN